MKNLFPRCFGTLIGLFFLLAAAAPAAEKISEPFHYQGYSLAQYPRIEKSSEYVPLSDGNKLAIDIYRPAGGPETSFPVIVELTPYTRAYIDLNNGPLHRAVRKGKLKTTSPVLDMLAVKTAMGDQIKMVIGHGYVFVRADLRGCGASSGWKADFMPRMGKDGGELIDWIAKQPWCSGNVGMIGASYSAYSQFVTAQYAGPALKAIAPVVTPLDGFDGQVYPGGIYQYKFMHDYSHDLGRLNLNYYEFNIGKLALHRGQMMLPAAPVVDEDGDGDLTDESPIDLNHNGTFLDDYRYPEDPSDPPRYRDGNQRKHLYYLAIRDHRYNANYHFWAQNLMYIDQRLPHPFSDNSSYDFSPASAVPAIMKKNIAIYDIGGWHDLFSRGTTEYYSTLKKTNPSRLWMHPGYHPGGGPYWNMYLKENFLELIGPELLRYFDFYLKGIDNGFDKEPPVLIYVQNGEGWRTEREWPLARQVVTNFYFDADHGLSQESAQAGTDRYTADYSHDSRYGKNLSNRYIGGMGKVPDALPIRTEKDKQCLTYTGKPLDKETEVTGHPIINFWVSSSANEGDFFVYLEDVDENGQVVLVTEGLHRAGFNKLVDNNREIMAGATGVDVLPDLPWAGYERKDFTDSVFKDGKIVKLTFDLKPTSWVFKKGHRIRVAIACSDWPTFRLNERLAPDNDPKSPTNIAPTITMQRGDQYPSAIALPVIPR